MVNKFLRTVLVIFITVILLFVVANFVYYKTERPSRMVAYEVYEAINVANQKTEYTKLALGDSVARQFLNQEYQGENQEVCYLPTNQAIMAAGNYVLLECFLENNPQTKEVYYILRPDSLTSSANFVYTYSYFITPLYTDSFKQYLDEKTVVQLEHCYGKMWINSGFTKWLLAKYPKALELYYEVCEKKRGLAAAIWGQAEEMPDMSLPYLQKMYQLCESKNITLHLISSPVKEDFAYDMEELKNTMHELKMSELYIEFVDSIQHIDGEEFLDGIHFREEYIEKNREKHVNDWLGN